MKLRFANYGLGAFAAISMTALIVGCGPKAEDKPAPGIQVTPQAAVTTGGGKVVGVSLTSRNHNFFIGMEQGVTDELKAQGYTADIQVAEDSASAQQQEIDTFIRKGVSAIIMVPADAKQAITPVMAANKANIPIFCIDRRVTDPSATVTATIETDNKAMATEAAKYALKLLCERYKLDPTKPDDVKKLKTTIVHNWGIEAASSAQDRAAGFDTVFNATATPNVKIVKVVGEFNAKKSQEVMAPTLKANPDIDLVFNHNDDNAIGTLNAVLDLKKSREPVGDPSVWR